MHRAYTLVASFVGLSILGSIGGCTWSPPRNIGVEGAGLADAAEPTPARGEMGVEGDVQLVVLFQRLFPSPSWICMFNCPPARLQARLISGNSKRHWRYRANLPALVSFRSTSLARYPS
jgi:hypothetical protein